MNESHQARESLWILTIAPTIWALHLLLSYVTVAVWCAKFAGESGSLGGTRTAIGIYTAIALIGISAAGWIGFKRHSHGNASLPHDADHPEDRHRFLGFAAFLLSALSAVATIFVASAAYFIENCD